MGNRGFDEEPVSVFIWLHCNFGDEISLRGQIIKPLPKNFYVIIQCPSKLMKFAFSPLGHLSYPDPFWDFLTLLLLSRLAKWQIPIYFSLISPSRVSYLFSISLSYFQFCCPYLSLSNSLTFSLLSIDRVKVNRSGRLKSIGSNRFRVGLGQGFGLGFRTGLGLGFRV